MPPTRSTLGQNGSRQSVQLQPPPQDSIPDQEVIVLSSDEDEPAPREPVVSRPRARVKPASVVPPAPQDVVDTVSEGSSSSTQKQLEKAERVCAYTAIPYE